MAQDKPPTVVRIGGCGLPETLGRFYARHPCLAAGTAVKDAPNHDEVRRRAYEMYLERWEKHQHQELARVHTRVDRERRRRCWRLSSIAGP